MFREDVSVQRPVFLPVFKGEKIWRLFAFWSNVTLVNRVYSLRKYFASARSNSFLWELALTENGCENELIYLKQMDKKSQ